MSNISFTLCLPDAVLTSVVLDHLGSCFVIAAHAPFRGSWAYDLRARTIVRSDAMKRFAELRDDVTSDVATILWRTEEDHLVDSALHSLVDRVSYPVVEEFLRLSAHWKGNPSLETFHERLTRFVRSITAQKTNGGDHAGSI